MKGIAVSAVGVALLVGLAGCPRPTPITRYDATPVTIEPEALAQALNDAGEVAGTDETLGGPMAALWSEDGGIEHLVTAEDMYSEARSVTNTRVAVGLHETEPGAAGTNEVVLWQYASSFGIFDYDEDDNTQVYAVNEALWSVGSIYSHEMDGDVPALFTADGLKAAWDLSTFDQGLGVAFDINEADQIVGAVNTGPMAARTAVLWTREGISVLAGLAAADSHYAYAINDLGVIVGASFTDTEDEDTGMAWVDRAGVTTALPDLGGGNGVALDVNNGGAIAGWSEDANGTQHAVVWDPNPNGTYDVVNLQERLVEGDADAVGLTLTRAIDINNVGQILAEGEQAGEAVHVLLTP